MKQLNNIPADYSVCLHTDCPLDETCLHQLAYRQKEEMGAYLKLINPSKCTRQKDCTFYADCKPVRFAKGFTGFQRRMFPEQYNKFMTTLILHFGRNQYFARRKGKTILSPEEQKVIRYVLKEVGADYSMDFDQYIENIHWIP